MSIPMTEEMKRVLITKKELTEEVEYCHNKATEVFKAGNISLPMVNENGKAITQKARLSMYNIEYYWVTRRDAALKLLYLITEHPVISFYGKLNSFNPESEHWKIMLFCIDK